MTTAQQTHLQAATRVRELLRRKAIAEQALVSGGPINVEECVHNYVDAVRLLDGAFRAFEDLGGGR